MYVAFVKFVIKQCYAMLPVINFVLILMSVTRKHESSTADANENRSWGSRIHRCRRILWVQGTSVLGWYWHYHYLTRQNIRHRPNSQAAFVLLKHWTQLAHLSLTPGFRRPINANPEAIVVINVYKRVFYFSIKNAFFNVFYFSNVFYF